MGSTRSFEATRHLMAAMGRLRQVSARLAVRWPALSVLRLPWILGWVICAGVVAFALAPLYVGAPTSDLRPTVYYMQGWTVFCFAVAVAWMTEQWRRRPSLPPGHAVPLSWSPGASSMVLSLIFAPVMLGGYSADRYLRSLHPYDVLETDAELIVEEAFPQTLRLRDRTPAVARLAYNEHTDLAIPLRGRDLISADTFAAITRYVDEQEVVTVKRCTLVSAGIIDPDSWPPPLHPDYGKVIGETCGATRLGRTLADNLRLLVMAHGRRWGAVPESEDPINAAGILSLAVILGIFSGAAPTLSFQQIAGTSVVIFVLLIVLSTFTTPAKPRFVFDWTPIGSFGAAWATLLFLGLAWRSKKPHRNVLLSTFIALPIALSGFLFFPIFIRQGGESVDPAIKTVLFVNPLVSIVLGIVVTPVLSRYRKLPRAT